MIIFTVQGQSIYRRDRRPDLSLELVSPPANHSQPTRQSGAALLLGLGSPAKGLLSTVLLDRQPDADDRVAVGAGPNRRRARRRKHVVSHHDLCWANRY